MGAHSELLKEKKGKSPLESNDQRVEREGQRWRKGKNNIGILVFPKNDAKCNAWLKNR